MNKQYCKILLTALALTASVSSFATAPVITIGAAPVAKVAAKASESGIIINGTGSTGTFTVNASNLSDRIKLTASAGLEVFPEALPATAQNATVHVTLLSSLPQTNGYVILRSGDYRISIPVTGYGTPLEQKALDTAPVYTGAEKTYVAGATEGFTAGKNGYTVEVRAKLDKAEDVIDAFAVTEEGAAFKAYIEENGIGLYNGDSKVSFANPATQADGGKQKFYNRDGKFHTYRFAVTPDSRVFVYRDGVQVAILRANDYGHQAEWGIADAGMSENLLKNPGFEGEWNLRADSLVNKIEGWIVDPIDRYNCTYEVPNYESNNELDHYNHVLKLQRYNWNDGWGAGTVSQIVDVAPNSTYSLSFLAMGGMDEKSNTNMSSVKIQEVQDSKLGNSVTITNNDKMKEYGMNYTTSAGCKQIKVIVHNERFLNGGGWGSSPQPFYVDEMALVGTARKLDQKVGFASAGAKVEYFTYDITGAYAPVTPVLAPAESAVVLEGVGSSKDINVKIANLVSADKVSVSATTGFSVSPSTLDADKDGVVRVTLNSTLAETSGKLIIRSGDMRAYVDLTGYAAALEEKDIKENAIVKDDAASNFSHDKAAGFTAGENGYTVEFRVKVSKNTDLFDAFAVAGENAAFKAYVEAEGIGLYNGTSKVNIENPASSVSGGKKKFYNNDGKFHTYRFAVTSDKRVLVYRDGLFVTNLRTSDYANQAEWAIANGEMTENLLKNGNFEGEYNYRATDSLLNRVEGWIVDPIDQYNCNYDVEPLEVNNELDHNNHAMMLKRYNWNDGWGAGTVSQVVDVAPNSTYSLSFLAMGGIDNKSGTHMSSVKIQEVQNAKNGTSTPIINEDEMKEYGVNYTTSADCKQIKVILHNERFLNGGGWGSSPTKTYFDQMSLSGMSRKLDQKVGYNKTSNVKVEYFAYDTNGAYAPLAPAFGSDYDGIEEVTVNEASATVAGDGFIVNNVANGAAVTVYDAGGILVASVPRYVAGTLIGLPRHGLYLCVVHTDDSTKTIKVIY